MRIGLLGTKVGMTRVIDPSGKVDTVTVVKAGPCVVLQVKTKDCDGYDAVQLGYGDAKPHRSTKPLIGHAGKAGAGPKRTSREFRLSAPAEQSAGDVVTVKLFSDAQVSYVDVTGITKGKGMQGVMRRHGFGGMGASHGTERKHRGSGGIGGGAPRGHGRAIKKCKRMAGHMGNVRCTASSLRLIKVDPEHDVMLIRGSVPGPIGSTVMIRKAKKRG